MNPNMMMMMMQLFEWVLFHFKWYSMDFYGSFMIFLF